MKLQQGVVYLWMLFLVFLLGLGLGKTLEVYSTVMQREKEAELLYVGGLYREAIRQYYLSSPGSVKEYPEKLEDLLKDPRHLLTRRYLRKLYVDPMTRAAFVPLPSPQGGIAGVRSNATGKPWRQVGFGAAYPYLENADSYQHWQFVYQGEPL